VKTGWEKTDAFSGVCAITHTNKQQHFGDCIYQNLRGEDVQTTSDLSIIQFIKP